MLQRLATGLLMVATSLRPSALASTDVYCSRPTLARRESFRFRSNAHSHGPEPSPSRAT